MEIDYAKMYGIDIRELRQESFLHPGHWRMVREHEKRVEAYYSEQDPNSRHTEGNNSGRLNSGKVITNKKNGQ